VSDENKSREELLQEVRELRRQYATATHYIRQKVNQLLKVMGTSPLKPEELDDATLIELDPISIVSDSFAQVLAHLKETNEEVRIAHDEITAIFNSAGMGILVIDRDMRVLAFNKKAEEQFHADPAVTGKLFCHQLICHRERPEAACPARIALDTGASCQVEQALGGRFYNVVATPIKDKDDEISRIVLVYMDMTERILTQEHLKISEERYRDLFENSTDLIQVVSADSSIKFVNRAWLTTLGYQEQDLPNMSIFDIVHPDCVDCGPEFKSVVCGFKDGRFETSFITKDKRKIIVEGDVTAITEQGKFAGTRGIFRDITERKRTEELIAAEREQLSVTLRSIGDGVITTDTRGKVILINQVASQLTGWDQASAYGEPITDVFFLEDEATGERRYCPIDAVLRTGAICDLEGNAVLVGRDNTRRLINDSVAPLRGKDNVLIGAVLVFRDITERKKLEDQLRQSQKMESVGQLAGGIAHDFNNILSVVLGYGSLVLRKMPTDDPNRVNIEYMLEAGKRAAHLTKDLLLFSRKQITNKRPVDLNEIVRKIEKFLRRVIGEDIEFKTTFHEYSMPVLGDAHQLEQVLMNLATNARDAMPAGGMFTISMERVKLDARFISSHGFGKPGTYVLLKVSDTGRGIDAATREHVFEPFFTTKEVGKGTGLGLAVVYGIIKQHEGFIQVYSEPDRGTTFKMYLPLIKTGVDEGTELPEEYPVGGTESILLAEDEEIVRNMTRSVLEDVGYQVITADNGQEAIEQFKKNKGRIQLLLFDIIMPKKTGQAAYEEIRALQPDIKIIFQSGYAADFIHQKTLIDDKVTVVSKPISPTDLLKQVRAMLDRIP